MKQHLPILIMLMSGLTAYAGVTERLDSLFEARYGDCNDAPGAAVIIAKDGDIVYERYFGLADMDTKEPITAETTFNIASVSKQFTVAALLQQDVDIDWTVDRFFDFPQDFWRKISLRQLASHTSGVPDSRDRSDRQRCVYATDSISFAYFPTVKELKFEPGSAYDYLNPSFILLAKVVEQRSHEEFTKYMQRHIFGPLGMQSTYYFDPETHPARQAHGYQIDDDGNWYEYDYGEETFFATRPDGGIYSTARDMLKWEDGLASGKVLPLDKLRMAYAPHIEVSDSPWCDYQRRPDTWYGLGWFIDTSAGYPIKVYHTGDNGGFQAYVAKYPKTHYNIIVLENRNDQDRWSMARAIDDILNGR